MRNYWEEAKQVPVRVSREIVGGFSLGFDKEIPEETQDQLIDFVYWVEDNYRLPVTLWVDFRYRHYLLDQANKRVGYKFYWADFENYPVFEKEADIPVIELPVKTEKWTMEEILASFIDAITRYFAWLCNEHTKDFEPDEALTEEILQKYLAEGKCHA